MARPPSPYLEDIRRILLIVAEVEQHVIQPRPQDPADGAADENVHHLVEVHFPFVCHSAAEENRDQEAHGNQHTVPADGEVIAEKRKLQRHG